MECLFKVEKTFSKKVLTSDFENGIFLLAERQ